MILGIPVMNGHELTNVMLDALVRTVQDPENFIAVIIDNNSRPAYRAADYKNYPFKVEVINYSENRGYYYPLKLLFNKWDTRQWQTPNRSKLIGLVHNDLIIYREGWDRELQRYFDIDPQLGLVGLCGSNEIDEKGGRGNGTMVNFVGNKIVVGKEIYQGQDPAAGAHINMLKPACVLDSLFMMFNSEVVRRLERTAEDWEALPLAHFYDRIWPCRVLLAGFKVAIAPFDNDHIGGLTTTGNERYREDCIKWLNKHGYPYENPETEMYLLAERRFLGEYREGSHFIPCRVDENYKLEHTYEHA